MLLGLREFLPFRSGIQNKAVKSLGSWVGAKVLRGASELTTLALLHNQAFLCFLLRVKRFLPFQFWVGLFLIIMFFQQPDFLLRALCVLFLLEGWFGRCGLFCCCYFLFSVSPTSQPQPTRDADHLISRKKGKDE
jgi:hypothetical protein